MKTIISSFLIAAGLSFSSNAQESLRTGLGFGMQLVEYQNDFGMGLNVTSPYFANNCIGVRLRANLMYHQGVSNGSTSWFTYSNYSLGIIGVGGFVSDRIRLYGEGGTLLLLPSNQISSSTLEIGGYGAFGFEFFFSPSGNYYIEVGGAGTGAVADRLDTEPVYSNGLTLSTGFRFFLK